MNLEFSRQNFDKYLNFIKNPPSASRAVPCGPTDGQSNSTKPTVAFRKFANESKIIKSHQESLGHKNEIITTKMNYRICKRILQKFTIFLRVIRFPVTYSHRHWIVTNSNQFCQI